MTLEQLHKEPGHLLLKCISGSRAYNLDLPESDTDIKGVFVLPRRALYGLSRPEQVANASNDEVYYEVGRFIELLQRNNPNLLELLSTPPSATLYRHPLMALVRPEDFLSKLCRETFAGYAATQVRKARGLNKKINRPVERERRSVLDFCHVAQGNGSVPLHQWLEEKGWKQEDCGLAGLPHFRDAYLLFTATDMRNRGYVRGIVSGPEANDVQLSSIPKGIEPAGFLSFNKDAYSIYCREYLEYWEWVEKRNDARYRNTLSHGKNYDAKNLMHTLRLLSMAEEIALHKKVIVHRADRDFLLQVRSGAFEYEELMKMVEEKMHRIDELYERSDLPDTPDAQKTERLLIQMREQFYESE